MKENIMTTNFEPHECVIFVQSTKIGTHENKAIHSIRILIILRSPKGGCCSISDDLSCSCHDPALTQERNCYIRTQLTNLKHGHGLSLTQANRNIIPYDVTYFHNTLQAFAKITLSQFQDISGGFVTPPPPHLRQCIA